MKTDILPVGPLMKEHRVIERMVKLIANKLAEYSRTNKPEPAFLYAVMDFLKVYADRCHHGKEEDILFARLNEKRMSQEHKKIMERLLSDHRFGRKAVSGLEEATARFVRGDAAACAIILEKMKALAELYPPHIEIEDKGFFLPCMNYFDKKEQQKMLEDNFEFDRKMIHEKYKEIVESLERSLHVQRKD